MTSTRFDLTPFLGQDEGQHFDRKSLFEGPEGSKRARDRKTVRDQVAEYVAAFANADATDDPPVAWTSPEQCAMCHTR